MNDLLAVVQHLPVERERYRAGVVVTNCDAFAVFQQTNHPAHIIQRLVREIVFPDLTEASVVCPALLASFASRENHLDPKHASGAYDTGKNIRAIIRLSEPEPARQESARKCSITLLNFSLRASQ